MKFEELPEEIIGKVIEVVERTARQIHFAENDLKFLFDVWNTHIDPTEKQDINCKGCRTRVIGKLRMYVQQYRQANPE